MAVAKFELHWNSVTEHKLLDRIIFQLYINLIPVWTCMLVLDRPQIKEPLIVSIVRMYIQWGYYGLVVDTPRA